ncbi:STAS domain-containing protein [Mesobacterium sp. TK19101]|uniref:STAS domain-containing protein n=1 Tax=Mesobacterium hydrothermale TaxID=3111907 RepID=A0ABU6HJM7_9RHOB|nr:STAS domain-containing protein [Mesobacterium sp. TK19101]MEC3862516.1 STAS domain-containing protein [Mesobacterium sp. TK19101]
MLTHALADRRPRNGTDTLLTFLQGAVGKPVCLSVAAVDRIDSLRLRTLLSAQAKWRSLGLAFGLTDISDTFRAGLVRLGLPETQFDPERI